MTDPTSAEAGGQSLVDTYTRRRFLAVLAGAPTLVMATQLLDLSIADDADAAVTPPTTMEEICDISEFIVMGSAPTMPLVTLEVGQDGIARLELPRIEMGQGITTSVAMMIAEDLDLPLERVEVSLADARPELMFNQMTAGSCTLRTFQKPLQGLAAGARARMMLAASTRWGVPVSSLTVKDGVVLGPDGLRADYGELAVEAKNVSLDGVTITPKPLSEYRLIGTPTRRVDALEMVTGAKKFAMDLHIDKAKPAMVRRGPTVASAPKSINNAEAVKAMPGVRAVVAVPTGVAVVADTFEQARQGVNALDVDFGPGPIDNASNESIIAELRRRMKPFDSPLPGTTVIETEFDFAGLTHAPMETECAIADVRADGADLWAPFQAPILAQQSIALDLGLPLDSVKAHVTKGGGGFGRRVFYDAPLEAARISKAAGMPVRLMWSRTEDIRHARSRPMQVHRFRASVLNGQVVGFEQRVSMVSTDFRQGLGEYLSAAAATGDPRAKQSLGNDMFGQGVFTTMVSSPYQFGRYKKELLPEWANGQPTASYRSVPCQPARSAEEIMVNEVAAALGVDPVQFRLAHLKDPRTKLCLTKAAELGDWGKMLPAGWAQGVGIHIEGRCHMACVADLDASRPEYPVVRRVVMTIDVGLPVNPMTIEAQMLGGIAEAVSLVFRAGLTFKDGLPLESSFADYRWLRMKEFPKDVTIHVFPANGNVIGGIGEVGMAAPSAALANAYAKATGIKPRSFPLLREPTGEPVPPDVIPPPAHKTR